MSAMTVKTDRRDARGKSANAQEVRAMLTGPSSSIGRRF
jgi:hypothetical protein